MKLPEGYLVAIEGIDAVGKNTHALLLSKWLKARRFRTTLMSFPDYHTPIGREIRAFLSGRKKFPIELQHILFAANRWEKYPDIRSHLSNGKILIIDRYTQSNIAYGTANGLDEGWLSSLEKGMPKANLVIVLDAPSDVLTSRRRRRSRDAYERSTSLQVRAQEAYKELARRLGWELIDANLSVDSVQRTVVDRLRNQMQKDRGITI